MESGEARIFCAGPGVILQIDEQVFLNRALERARAELISALARAAAVANLNAMPDIVLTTLNAKFIHAAFGLRYLFANLGELQPRAVIAEFDINLRPLDITEALLAREPRIIGFGIYIWNVAPTTEVIAAIKRVRPEI